MLWLLNLPCHLYSIVKTVVVNHSLKHLKWDQRQSQLWLWQSAIKWQWYVTMGNISNKMNANREPVRWSEVPSCKLKIGPSIYSRFILTELRSEQGIKNIAGLEKHRVKPLLNKDTCKLHRTCYITRLLFGCQLWPSKKA